MKQHPSISINQYHAYNICSAFHLSTNTKKGLQRKQILQLHHHQNSLVCNFCSTMASEQMRRETPSDQRTIEVEKDRVPKMTTHFETITEKAKQEEQEALTPPKGGDRLHHHFETAPARVSGLDYSNSAAETGGEKGDKNRGAASKAESQPSLEEINALRSTAQQQSVDAIRAAEERYEKAKEKVAGTAEYVGQKAVAAKDTAADTTKSAAAYIGEKAGAAKDTTMDSAKTAAEYVGEKATAAKDATMDSTKSAAEYVGDKAATVKDSAVDATKNTADYVSEKVVAAKDVTVESGKGAAGYVGQVAAEVMDQARVTGWGAAHYTMEKVAGATKTVAGVTSNVVGYTSEKVAAAKDKAAEAGGAVMSAAGDKLAAAKDAVVTSEGKTREYVARKKEEASKDLEEKKSSQYKAGGAQDTFSVQEEDEYGEVFGDELDGGGVLQAIGETIVEIGQVTKDILLGGQYPHQQVLEDTDEYRSKDKA